MTVPRRGSPSSTRRSCAPIFGGENPVGRRIGIGPAATNQVEIVGVAADAKYTELRGVTPATIYLPALQRLDGDANFAVRLSAPAQAASLPSSPPSALPCARSTRRCPC